MTVKRTLAFFVTATFFFSVHHLHAQGEFGVFSATGRGAVSPFVTDYHAIGINPANLDLSSEYEGKRVTFGFMEGSGAMYSEFLTRDEIRTTLLRGDFNTLSQAERSEYAASFANRLTRIDAGIITSGVSVQTENAGTFAFSTRERINMSARFGPMASELLFLGRTAPYFTQLVLSNNDTIPNTGNLSADTLNMVQEGIIDPSNALMFADLLDGTSIGFSWIREFNLAYGKRLFASEDIEIHGGVGVKLLVGNGYMQVDVDGTDVEAFSSFSPLFGIDYGAIANQNPSAIPSDANQLKPVGMGWGLDFGATVVIKEKLLLNAAINDIGRMTWDGNLYELNNQLLTEFTDPGAESVDVVDELINFASPESFLSWQGSSERTTNLPTIARVGAGFIVSEKLRLAADAVLPVNDNVVNYDEPIVALGADFRPLRFLQLSAGYVSGGEANDKIPLGLTFIVNEGAWEFGFASRDMLTWFNGDNPTVSMSWGFLRFRV